VVLLVVLTTNTSSSKVRSRVALIVGVVLVLVAGTVWWVASANGSSEAPAESALGDQTRVSAVHLVTADLEPMRAYYVDALGLGVLDETNTSISLGHEGTEILTVTEDPEGAKDSPDQAGLYHSAFLYEDEASLASALVRVAGAAPTSFQGSSDHTVSMAFYFGDPDGNGIEMYVDRPVEEWEWKDGKVTMGSAPLDPNEFIDEYLQAEAQADPGMGHVHLRVGDLEQARAFYADALGFAVTAEADGALFFGAGGYHHHVGTNVWTSQGAGARSSELGLGSLTIQLESAEERTAVEARLDAAGVNHQRVGEHNVANDPWGNTITLTAP
jgi:catechol 2,3-dioxygenase